MRISAALTAGRCATATDPWAFVKYRRADAPTRPVDERIKDWRVILNTLPEAVVQQNAARCMDCGTAFCEYTCPLGNQIPWLNALVSEGCWRQAVELLHATNNFPEFTGWLCPAPCEAGCVLAINEDAVAARQIELAVAERGFKEGWVVPLDSSRSSGRRVAVVGSGPAGLAAAQQLTRAGHDVTVFERADRIGGLLRYGVPDFRMNKALLDRRLSQLSAEGTRFEAGIEVGVDLEADDLGRRFDAVILACGATQNRELRIPGMDLDGVHQGTTYLTQANRIQAGDRIPAPIDAAGRDVAIIGGGDTASDCLATANRQGAASVRILDHNPTPPEVRDPATNPWPQFPRVRKHGFAQEEGVVEEWQAEVCELVSDGAGRVCGLRAQRVEAAWCDDKRHFEPMPGGDFEVEAQLTLLAMGFDGAEPNALFDELAVEVSPVGTLVVDEEWSTATAGIFACGDVTRGASLVAWAIAEGRSCAAAVHEALTGDDHLPRPIAPGDRPV
jgi:glutamate synthase (NADPH/NADH) small chain